MFSSVSELIVLPIVTSLIAAVIMYLLTERYAATGRFIFFGYPKIAGRWKSTYPDEPDDCGEYSQIKQRGGRITGEIDAFERNVKFTLNGYVTPDRILQVHYRPKDAQHTKGGTALLKLNWDLSQADGYLVFLPDGDLPPTPIKIHLTKQH
jgi:hypothetical protein